MEQLLALLNAIATMSPELQDHLRSVIHKKEFCKGDFILKEDDVCRNILFIEKGLVRIYHLLEEKEVTSWFLQEGHIFISVLSFFKQQPSYEYIVALEDCVCWGIRHDDLEGICERFPEFWKHRALITQAYYCTGEERRNILERLSPEERYALLLKNEAALVERLPVKLLPSYLHVSKRTLDYARSGKRDRSQNSPDQESISA